MSARHGFWALAGLSVLIAVSGCATTRSDRSSRTYEEIKSLREEIKKKDETIANLEEEIEKIKTEQPEPVYQESRLSSKGVLSVRQAQKILQSLGYYKGNVDGKDGKLTRQAIRAFQSEHGLKADGILGPKTSDKLSQTSRY